MKRTMPKAQLPKLHSRLAFELSESALAKWQPGLQARDGGADNTISIYGPIGEQFYDGVTVRRISAALRSIGDQDVIVNINSPGGDVFEGLAIYNLLRDHAAKVTTRVVGVAASSASVIAMAGDDIQIGRAAFMMIHNIWGLFIGNRNDLREAAEMLEPFDAVLAEIYASRSGKTSGEVAKLMDAETWLGGSKAVDEGFADDYLPADAIEETAKDDKQNSAVRRVDLALAKQGIPRAERRALLQQLRGTPGAAAESMHDAGVGVICAAFEGFAANQQKKSLSQIFTENLK